MFVEEAQWIRAVLEECGPSAGTVIDLGSSTEEFRRLQQPHIDYFVFLPLRRRRLSIVHVDAKAADGVDVVVDLAATNALSGVLSPA